MFKKRRRISETKAESETLSDLGQEPGEADGVQVGAGAPAVAPAFDRSEGPWDVGEVPGDDEVMRVDFGSVRVPGFDGMSISLEADEATQQVVAVTVGIEEGAVQLQPFAAPRSGGFWDEVRAEIAKGISGSGGMVDLEEGSLGPQLRAQIPVTTPDGKNELQSVRFVGVEGPRWLLRGVMLGAAAGDPRIGELFEDVVRGCVIVRGGQPMAPGDLLPMTLPAELVEQGEEEEGDDAAAGDDDSLPLNPFERGPEITEIH